MKIPSLRKESWNSKRLERVTQALIKKGKLPAEEVEAIQPEIKDTKVKKNKKAKE